MLTYFPTETSQRFDGEQKGQSREKPLNSVGRDCWQIVSDSFNVTTVNVWPYLLETFSQVTLVLRVAELLNVFPQQVLQTEHSSVWPGASSPREQYQSNQYVCLF